MEKWATPKDKDGKLDYHKAMTGDDLIDFVNVKLFPYLKKFEDQAPKEVVEAGPKI